ncbi:MAG: alpha-amylase [Candidatus Izimaplasma sp.]|nr:alpha-amylase [Candidatus Izimaplasma bacterium]
MSFETKKDLRSLFIYQIYVRNYSEQGNFKTITNDLDRIKSLGVDVVYLLPIHPIGQKNRKGKLGSPYSISDYRKVNNELGTLKDFEELINEIHKKGMKLMIDVVYNHTSFDSVLVKEHPNYFYKKDGKLANRVGDWWDVTDLDYTQDKELWEELIASLEYWSKLGVDGYRFDVASMLPLAFLKEMRNRVLAINPDTILLSESVHGGFCKHLRDQGFDCLSESEIYQVFDMAYDYDTHPFFEGYFKGRNDFQRYLQELIRQEEIYPENYIKMRNLENHDFGRFAKLVDNNLDKIKNWTALNFVSKGSTMIYAGQERCDDHLPDLFNKDVVRWDGKDISDLIRELNDLTNSKLTSHGIYNIHITSKDVFIATYERNNEKLVAICNIGLETGKVEVPLNDGTYTDSLNNEKVVVVDSTITLKSQPLIIKL